MRTFNGRTVNIVERGYEYIGGTQEYESLIFVTDSGERLQATMIDSDDSVLCKFDGSFPLNITDEVPIVTDDKVVFFNDDTPENSAPTLAVWLKNYFNELILPESFSSLLYSNNSQHPSVTPIYLKCDENVGHILKIHALADYESIEHDYFIFSDGNYGTEDGYVFPCQPDQGNQSSNVSYDFYIDLTGEYRNIFQDHDCKDTNAWVAYLLGVPLPNPLEVLNLV